MKKLSKLAAVNEKQWLSTAIAAAGNNKRDGNVVLFAGAVVVAVAVVAVVVVFVAVVVTAVIVVAVAGQKQYQWRWQ